MKKIALIGAGGKMGLRITKELKDDPEYKMTYSEINKEGIEKLNNLGLSITNQEQAVKDADIIIFAVPDKVISKVSKQLVPEVKENSIVVLLDPAAAYAGLLPNRKDITYFIVHPCHPPLFAEEANPEALTDWFGGIASQDIVCALHQGAEEHYEIGEELSKKMFGPIRNSYRMTTDEMIILEPALVESFTSTLVLAMKEAYEKAVEMGVDKDAAYGFLMGHLRVQFAVIFSYTDFPFSDANYQAISEAKDKIFKEDWMEQVFSQDKIDESVKRITGISN